MNQDTQCTYIVVWRRFCETIVAVKKQIVLHILSVCVALFIQHEKRMSRIILSYVACLTLPKRHGFRGGGGERFMNIDTFL
jgi:hypothetical protein